jgi:hypothetical protein
MVSPVLLEQAQALPAEERWELVDALLVSLDVGYSETELAEALEGLREYRAHPQAVTDADAVITRLRRQYA